MMNTQHSWLPWIVSGLIAMPVLYVASFGPVCRAVENERLSVVLAAKLYRPLVRLTGAEPGETSKWLCTYAELCGGYWGCYETLVELDVFRPTVSRCFPAPPVIDNPVEDRDDDD